MPTPIKILLFVLAGGLIGYSCAPSPSAFDISTRVAGWAGVFLVIAVGCVAFMDAPSLDDDKTQTRGPGNSDDIEENP